MKYECVFHNGTFVESRPIGFEWGLGGKMPPFEIIATGDLQPSQEDIQVTVGPYKLPISKIDPRLYVGRYAPSGAQAAENICMMIPEDLISKPLFKYCKREHACSMVEKGMFRIGTLFEFMSIEKHGTQVGDLDEGVKKTLFTAEDFSGRTFEELPEELRRAWFENGVVPDNAKGITIQAMNKKIGIVLSEIGQNFYVFCMTEEASCIGAREFGYDACVRISEPLEFIDALTKDLAKVRTILLARPALARCSYGTREERTGTKERTLPFLSKDAKYAYQKEVRAVWTPKGLPVEPVVIRNSRARDFCFIERFY